MFSVSSHRHSTRVKGDRQRKKGKYSEIRTQNEISQEFGSDATKTDFKAVTRQSLCWGYGDEAGRKFKVRDQFELDSNALFASFSI